MHSVISQGRVESIVTSKPRDRRMLIEEAAGLGKHRKRRRRAQLKLARTQDNLDRALDVEREARSRLRPLKRQAEAAELHARLERQTLEARWELGPRRSAPPPGRARRPRRRPPRRRAPSASGSSASSRASPGAARRPRRRSPGAAPIARSSRGAASWPSPPASAIAYRADAVRAAARDVEDRLRGGRERLARLREAAQADAAGPGGRRPDRRARAGAGPARSRPRGRAGAPARRARGRSSTRRRRGRRRPGRDRRARAGRARAGPGAARAGARRAARGRAGGRGRAARGRAGRRRARRRATSSCAARPRRPGGAAVLADQLDVDPGYELAVAAALDGRLRAAVLPRPAGRRRAARPRRRRRRPRADRAARRRRRSATRRRPRTPPARRSRAARRATSTDRPTRRRSRARLLRDVWVVESLERLSDRLRRGGGDARRAGVVVPHARAPPGAGGGRGARARRAQPPRRSWSGRARPRPRPSSRAGAALERHGEAVARAEAESERAIAAHRAAVTQRDEAERGGAPDRGGDRAPAGRARRRPRRRTPHAAGGRAGRGPRRRASASERERAERQARIERLRQATIRDEALLPSVRGGDRGARARRRARSPARREQFELALSADREAGEHVAAELKECAQQEAALHGQLRQGNERLTESQVRLQRVRRPGRRIDPGAAAALAGRLELEAEPGRRRARRRGARGADEPARAAGAPARAARARSTRSRRTSTRRPSRTSRSSSASATISRPRCAS